MTEDKLREKIEKILERHELETESIEGEALNDLIDLFSKALKKEREEIVRHIKEDNFHEMISDKNGWKGDRFIHRGELLNYLNPKKGGKVG